MIPNFISTAEQLGLKYTDAILMFSGVSYTLTFSNLEDNLKTILLILSIVLALFRIVLYIRELLKGKGKDEDKKE